MSAEPQDVVWSEDVALLVETVERLTADDQRRIVRVVDLLLLAPFEVRTQSQSMLRGLMQNRPESKDALVSGLDEIIRFLETALVPPPAPRYELTARH